MKNILVYINRNYNDWADKAVQIQIDNSLELGWKKEDIWLLTNFPYEYRSVKAIELEDVFYAPSPTVSKINATLKLFDMGMVEDELYWLHDLDAFQVSSFTEEEVNLGNKDIGLCNYGRTPMWAAGTVFFTKKAQDIFKETQRLCYEHRQTEQKSFRTLFGDALDNSKERHPMSDRYKLMNISYNFNTCNISSNWKQAIKPLKVVHFHLTPEMMDIFLVENPYLLTERFKKHFV